MGGFYLKVMAWLLSVLLLLSGSVQRQSFCPQAAALLPDPQAGQPLYLRVIARNDSPAAQAEKLRVRDAVRALCSAAPASLQAMGEAANQVAPCRTEFRQWSPNENTPAAPTVYITIGEGKGHNWWGVLYPDSLLLAEAEEGVRDSDQVTFVWPILSWLKGLLGLG